MSKYLTIKSLYAFIVFLIVAVTFLVYYSFTTVLGSSQWIEHSYRSINYGNQLKTTVLNLEKSIRNFVITGNTQFIDNYKETEIQFIQTISEIKQHVQDNSMQVQQLEKISLFTVSWAEEFATKIIENKQRLVAENNPDILEIFKLIQSNAYRELIDNIFFNIKLFVEMEETLLKQRIQENNTLVNQTIILILLGNIFIILCSFPLISSLIRYTWLTDGRSHLQEQMIGEQQTQPLAEKILWFLSRYLDAQKAVMYVPILHTLDKNTTKLSLIATYACHAEKSPKIVLLGDGLLGQAALGSQLLRITDVPRNYLSVHSGLGKALPRELLFFPIYYQDKLKGIIEFAFFRAATPLKIDFLQQSLLTIGAALHGAETHQHIQKLLEETQAQTNELHTQQEELSSANEELEEQYSTLEKQYIEINRINTQNIKLQEVNQAIEADKKAVELASHYKSAFLANMSHELRNPLNSILMLAEIFEENIYGNLNTKQIEQAKTIYNAGNDLLVLINDILDLARIEAGKLKIQAEPFVLEDLAKITYQKFLPIAEKKGLALLLEQGKDLPQIVFSDQRRIIQVMNNLLSNALKFTHQGQVCLAIYRPDRDELLRMQLPTVGIIALRVQDTGIGIPLDKQEIIFEPFQQADGTTNRRYGGTGLGLSISKQLIQLLNGVIHLHSEVDKGSCFTVYLPEQVDESIPTISATPDATLPLVQTNNTALTDQVLSPDETDLPLQFNHDKEYALADKKVLVVDDDERNLFALQLLLESKKMQVILAKNGTEALQLLAKNMDIAVVLMDIMMPDMDGYETIRRIRAQENHHKLPIIAITAKSLPSDREQCLLSGANEYLAKPINTMTLLALLKMWLYT
ncbi:response regulator [Beggiatoa leptomitoformis]|uniref:histidine kinase n=1 Tax=Beggiatoa leptomitoformis TaxID=288004 RepID=A0A2N9Y9V5_9GAMM|nr:response regulator [Beggiatoa leptomitoformis]AUI67242.1 response regulator [Beggiatoa leptomitoformis]QGX03592.1 response regulator [Beggiatoa leptomitoformis]